MLSTYRASDKVRRQHIFVVVVVSDLVNGCERGVYTVHRDLRVFVSVCVGGSILSTSYPIEIDCSEIDEIEGRCHNIQKQPRYTCCTQLRHQCFQISYSPDFSQLFVLMLGGSISKNE